MIPPIYKLWNGGLGDHWASINLLARLSMSRGQRVYYTAGGRERRAHDIRALLDLPLQVDLMCHVNPPAAQGLDGFNVWASEYFPTKVRWGGEKLLPFICAHFDGVSAASDKNPPPDDVARIRDWALSNGLEVYVLDGTLALAKIVNLLAQCTLFVGVDSGMAHIAHSVGCPTYLLEYQLPIVTCHRHKTYVRCEGAGHFASQATNWLDYLRFLRSP